MTASQHASELRIRKLLEEVETIENSLHLVVDEKVKVSREHKAEFYYGVLNGIIRAIKKECNIVNQNLNLKHRIKIRELQQELFKHCPIEFQNEVNQDNEMYTTID